MCITRFKTDLYFNKISLSTDAFALIKNKTVTKQLTTMYKKTECNKIKNILTDK